MLALRGFKKMKSAVVKHAGKPTSPAFLFVNVFFIYIISVIFAMRAVGAAVSFLGRLCLVTEMANTRFPRKAKGYPCVR